MISFMENRKDDIMKKLVLMLVVPIIVLLILTGCVPKPEEKCVTSWEYEIQEKQEFIITYTTYYLKTDHGKVQVTKEIYSDALEGNYSEVCILIEKGEETLLVGATLKDGTPVDKSIIEKIQDLFEEEETE